MANEMLKQIEAFVGVHLLGNEAQFDSPTETPLPVYGRFRETGLSNWWLPKSLGGRGINLEQSVDIVSELAYGDAGVAFTLFISIIGTSIVQLYGSDELKQRYLGGLATKGGFCALLGSEREAGSELIRMRTNATKRSNDYVVSGRKYFSTNAASADFFVCIAAVPDDPSGYAALIIPRDTPGVKIEKRWNLVGVRAAMTYQVTLQECRIPSVNLIKGNGLRLLEIGLNASRILMAATAVGISRRMRDLCLDYARTKSLKNSTLLVNPVFAAKLGQMEMQIEAMLTQCRAAARDWDGFLSKPNAPEELLQRGTLKSALVSKILCGQLGWQIASMGSEMFGGIGYTDDSLAAKLLRDVRYVSIVEGGDDVLRDLIFSRYVVPNATRPTTPPAPPAART